MAEKTVKEQIPTLSNPYNEEMVELKLTKAPTGKYSEDLIIGRNGEIYQLQRGVLMMVPKGIKEIVENQEKQDELVAEKFRELAELASKKK